MNQKASEKGMIIIAIVFILCICIGLSAVIKLFYSKTPLSVSRLKRFQAINYAQVGLYEAFNRFRTPGAGGWDPSVNGTYNITIDGVGVSIVVDEYLGKRRVSATVDQDDLNL